MSCSGVCAYTAPMKSSMNTSNRYFNSFSSSVIFAPSSAEMVVFPSSGCGGSFHSGFSV